MATGVPCHARDPSVSRHARLEEAGTIDVSAAASTFGLLFLAEWGDKSQLVLIVLARRGSGRAVATGAILAFALLSLLAATAGRLGFDALPQPAVLAAAGALFLVFAWRSWRIRHEEEPPVTAGHHVVLTTFVLVVGAELGDKTQITVAALAAATGDVPAVLVGSILALGAVSCATVALGRKVLARLPLRRIHAAGAILFALLGIVALARAALLLA